MLPLPSDLVGILRPYLSGLPADAPLWPGKWADHKRAGKFFRADLDAARKAWLQAVSSDEERAAREQSDFLRYEDSAGLFADFHALRHTFLSRLGRSGASLRVAMDLGRHTTPQMSMRYTHAGLYDLATAVEQLPALPIMPPDNRPQTLRATGTDPAGESGLPERDAVRCVSMRPDAGLAGDREEAPSIPL